MKKKTNRYSLPQITLWGMHFNAGISEQDI